MARMGFIREYLIFHKSDPSRKIRLRTPRTLTIKQVKKKMVAAGFFPETIIKELRVENISK